MFGQRCKASQHAGIGGTATDMGAILHAAMKRYEVRYSKTVHGCCRKEYYVADGMS